MEPKKKTALICAVSIVVGLLFFGFGVIMNDTAYMFSACIAIPAVIIWEVYSYFHEKKDDKKTLDHARSIMDNSYFNTLEWREKYIVYRMEHPFEKPQGKSMKSDLYARYRCRDILLLGLVFLFFACFSVFYMFKSFAFWEPIGTVICAAFAFTFLDDYTGRVVRKFLKRDIDYDKLERSYLSGRMMTYNKSGIIFGTTHIHVFTPTNIYAIDYRIADDITRKVVRVKEYDNSTYTGYRYSHYAVIHASIPVSGSATTVEVKLNEFQVQIAIDEFHRIKHPDKLGTKPEYSVKPNNNVSV